MTDQELLIKIKADTGKATKEINRLNKEVKNLQKTSDGKWGKNTKKSFDNVGVSANKLNGQLKALAVTYLSFASVKSLVVTSANIEEGFLGVAKTTGLTGEALDGLKDSILDLSTEMAGIKLEELQSIAETAGQLGISGTANILEFTEVIAKIGATTELSAEEAATGMAKLGNSMKVDVSDFEKLGSVINELSNTTTATAGDLLAMGQRVSGVGKTFGLTADEVLGLSATLTDVGISSELGGTAISKVMLEMLKDTKAFAEASGVSFNDFSRLIKEKPIEALETFIQAIGKLDKAAKIEALDKLGLKSSGVTQTMLKLSGATDVLTRNLTTAGDEWARNTSLQNEYDVASEGFNAQIEKVGNTIKKLAFNIGETLLPALKKVAEDFADWVNSLDEAKLAEFGEDIAGVATALASVAGAVGSFVTSLASFATDYPTLTKGLLGLIVALKAINFLLPAVGASMAVMGGRSVALGATTGALTTSIGLLGGAAKTVIGLAGPWGVAFAAMASATSIAVDAYVDSQKRANQASEEMNVAQTKNATALNSISDSYIKANEEVKERGAVTKKTRDEIEQALKSEIAAVEKNLKAWENNADSTKETNERALVLAGTLGDLKAQLDTLDARYTIDLEMETNEAFAAIEEVKTTASEPVTSELGFNPNTQAADSARDAVSRPIIVPVTYVPTNSPPRVARANGGLVPQKLAEGGVYTGSGKVPGYDISDSDKVNAKLTGGEYVIKRSAVDKIGLATLNAINTLKMPSIKGYADGGLVGNATPTAQTPINLNIGDQSYQVMSDFEVAEALTRHIDSKGGM